MGKKMEYNSTVHRLFIDLKKAYDSIRRDVVYSILIEFGVSWKLTGLMRLNAIYSTIRIGKYQYDKFPIQNGLKQGDGLSPLLFNVALKYAIRRVQGNQKGLKVNGKHLLWAYGADVNVVGENVDTVKKNAEALLDASRRLV
jgi:hypothetical protein